MKLIFFIKILSIKLISCIFAVFVFANFTQLGDAERYSNAELDVHSIEKLVNRTFFTDNFFAVLSLFFGRNFALNFFTAFLVSAVIYFVYKEYVKFIPRIFWLVLILPSFAVWTSVVGKEALSFCAFLLISKWIVEKLIYGKSNFSVLAVGLIFGLIVRPHYGIAYVFVVLMLCLSRHRVGEGIKKRNFSLGAKAFFMLTTYALFFIFAWIFFYRWEIYLHEVMEVAQNYFSIFEDNSSRTWVAWESGEDFFLNMWWGIPLSLLGPTLNEVFNRSVFLLPFLEGVVFVFLIPYILYRVIRFHGDIKGIKFFMLCILTPGVLGIMLIHYPFGIFNPGSANRYKQALTPLFYFLPILLIAVLSKKRHEKDGFNS